MKDFLEAIWGELDGRYGEIRALGDKYPNSSFSPEVDIAMAEAMSFDAAGLDAYFGVLPRSRAKGDGASIADETTVLWADVDAKAFADKAAAFFAIGRVILQPQVIVDSGNGYHAYWLLDRPVPFDAAQEVMKGIAITTGADRVYDKARILRVPGTRNHKGCDHEAPCIGLPVRLLRLDITDRRHRFSDFADLAETAHQADRRPRRTRVVSTEGWNPSDEDAPKFGEGGRNHGLTRLAGIMLARGLDEAEILDNLMHENEMRCDPPLPEREVAHIARSVMRYAR